MNAAPSPAIRVLVVDDQELVRAGFCVILDNDRHHPAKVEPASGTSRLATASEPRVRLDPFCALGGQPMTGGPPPGAPVSAFSSPPSTGEPGPGGVEPGSEGSTTPPASAP
jgi:hypothetical protein